MTKKSENTEPGQEFSTVQHIASCKASLFGIRNPNLVWIIFPCYTLCSFNWHEVVPNIFHVQWYQTMLDSNITSQRLIQLSWSITK